MEGSSESDATAPGGPGRFRGRWRAARADGGGPAAAGACRTLPGPGRPRGPSTHRDVRLVARPVAAKVARVAPREPSGPPAPRPDVRGPSPIVTRNGWGI